MDIDYLFSCTHRRSFVIVRFAALDREGKDPPSSMIFSSTKISWPFFSNLKKFKSVYCLFRTSNFVFVLFCFRPHVLLNWFCVLRKVLSDQYGIEKCVITYNLLYFGLIISNSQFWFVPKRFIDLMKDYINGQMLQYNEKKSIAYNL